MTMNDTRLLSMQTFIRIAEAGSLSAAAAQLGTSQPTVSRRLRSLEDSIGVRLVDRTTHAMQLTDAGRRYFTRAKELLREWEELDVEVRGDADAPEGVLRVVAPHAFGQAQLLAPALEYLRTYPKMTIEWILHDGPVRFVEDGIDCALRAGRVEEEAVVVRRLFDVARIVVAAPSVVSTLPTRPAQLASAPWLALSTYYRNAIKLENDRGGEVTLHIRPRFLTGNLFALKNAVHAGLGVAVISEWIVRDDIARGALVHLLPRWHSYALPVSIVYPHARFHPAKLRAFVEALRAAFPRGVAT